MSLFFFVSAIYRFDRNFHKICINVFHKICIYVMKSVSTHKYFTVVTQHCCGQLIKEVRITDKRYKN